MGWDCLDESDYYDQFTQEMHGWDDDTYAEWLGQMIQDDPTNPKYVAALAALQEKRQSNGR